MPCYMYQEQDAMMGLLFLSPKWDALHHDLPTGCHDYDDVTYALMEIKLRVTLEEFSELKYDAWHENL